MSRISLNGLRVSEVRAKQGFGRRRKPKRYPLVVRVREHRSEAEGCGRRRHNYLHLKIFSSSSIKSPFLNMSNPSAAGLSKFMSVRLITFMDFGQVGNGKVS